jgi:hypothetical protein
MTAGDRAEPELDQDTVALRSLLLRALDDEDARAQALAVVSQRRVLAATWPASPESVRTLTNSDGELAMPLFTGPDELAAAAERFGWLNPDGSLSSRELSAREALQSALAQRVHFVVLDLCARHAAEFAQDEIERVLAPKAKARTVAGRRSARPSSGPTRPITAPLTAPQVASPLLAEIDVPFARERPSVSAPRAVEEVVVPRSRDGAQRRDPRAEPESVRVRTAVAAVPLAARAPKPAAVPKRPETPSRAPAAASAPRAIAPPSRAPVAAPAPRAITPSSPVPTAASFDLAAFEQVVPAAPVRVVPQAPQAEPAVAALALPALPALAELPVLEGLPPDLPLADGPALGEDFDFGSDGGQPEAKPAALEAAVMMTQLAKMTGDSATQQAATEVAAMLKDMAVKGGVDESKPSATQSAAKTLAGMLTAELAADQKRSRRGSRTKVAPAPAPEPEPAAAAAETGGAAVQRSAGDATGFQALGESLGDALLNLIAEELRKYPEVEWACEVADGTAVPVVGVRVDPAFLTRAAEITAAVMQVASTNKARLSVMLLSEAQKMRDARSAGSVFFPWRKRAKR